MNNMVCNIAYTNHWFMFRKHIFSTFKYLQLFQCIDFNINTVVYLLSIFPCTAQFIYCLLTSNTFLFCFLYFFYIADNFLTELWYLSLADAMINFRSSNLSSFSVHEEFSLSPLFIIPFFYTMLNLSQVFV